ncbi:MAG: hypothetical protein R3F14_20365 [Polyangiaceae bacterium]
MRSLRGYKLPSGGRLDLSQLAMTTGFLAGRTPYNVSAFDFRGMIDYVEEKSRDRPRHLQARVRPAGRRLHPGPCGVHGGPRPGEAR